MKRNLLFLLPAMFVSVCTGYAGKMWSVKECMLYAVENHPEVKIQEIYNDNTEIAYRNSKLAYLPTLSANASVSASYGRTVDPETNMYTTTSRMGSDYSLSIGGGIPVFDGFSTVNNIKINRIATLQGVETHQQLIDDLSLRVIQAYFNVISARELITIAERQLEAEKATLRGIRIREELGLRSSSDELQGEASVAEYESLLISRINSYNSRILALKDLMYYPLDEELLLDTLNRWEEILPIVQEESADEIFERAAEFLPSAVSGRMDLQRAQLNLKTAKWQLLPSISLGYPTVSTGYSRSLSGSNDNTLSFADQMRRVSGRIGSVNMSIPIFGRLSQRSAVRRSKNSLMIAQYQYDVKLRNIEKEIQAVLQELEGARREYELSVKQLAVREDAHKANQRKYEEGLISIMDLQTSSNTLLSARANRLSAQFIYLIKQREMEYYKGTRFIDQEF